MYEIRSSSGWTLIVQVPYLGKLGKLGKLANPVKKIFGKQNGYTFYRFPSAPLNGGAQHTTYP